MQPCKCEARVMSMTVVTSAYGSGQRITSVAIEYSEDVCRGSLNAEMYEVEGYTIDSLCVSDTARGELVWNGRFVQLLLSGEAEALSLCRHVGRGMDTRLQIRRPVLAVSQKQDILTSAGNTVPAFDRRLTTEIDLGIADKFIAASFTTKEGRRLNYNLYVPDHMVAGQMYPVVLFMHDLASCSEDTAAPLLQGTGATVWAIESYYNRRPCFIVAPQYTRQCAQDDYTVTWESEATLELMEYLFGLYPMDRRRLYGTGQSMGCMMLCDLMVRHPHTFAGCLLVAGQWEPAQMGTVPGENLWIVVSRGDAKAFPTMRAVVGEMEKGGARICYGHVSARADAAWLDAAIRSQKQKNANVNMTWFEGRSVVPDNQQVHPGAHHVNTWVKAYDIKALREWLFEQRLQ